MQSAKPDTDWIGSVDRNGAMPDLCPQLQPSAPLHATSMSRFLTFLMRTIALIDMAGLREGKRGREKGAGKSLLERASSVNRTDG